MDFVWCPAHGASSSIREFCPSQDAYGPNACSQCLGRFGSLSADPIYQGNQADPLSHVNVLQYTQSTRIKLRSPRTRFYFEWILGSIFSLCDRLLCASYWNPSLSHRAFNFSTLLTLPTFIIPESKILPNPPESKALSYVSVIRGFGLGPYLFMLC